ncbi:hypothetical protein V6N13_145213 [Hibiscus sabdariffa]|uniref:Uncharacterized protein n=2 Tax=Hibiscus sabdariffa TaxID=183260 RepID=A0ABR1ZJL7_9ROSI
MSATIGHFVEDLVGRQCRPPHVASGLIPSSTFGHILLDFFRSRILVHLCSNGFLHAFYPNDESWEPEFDPYRENKEMAATIASKSSFLRPIIRTAATIRTKIPFSVPNPPLRSNFTLHQTRISPFSLSRLVRRELSTLQPFHSAVASACLVSRLRRNANSCVEGRFANYLSPI